MIDVVLTAKCMLTCVRVSNNDVKYAFNKIKT